MQLLYFILSVAKLIANLIIKSIVNVYFNYNWISVVWKIINSNSNFN